MKKKSKSNNIEKFKYRYRFMTYRSEYSRDINYAILPEHREVSTDMIFNEGDLIHLDGIMYKVSDIEHDPLKEIIYIYLKFERILEIKDEIGCSTEFLQSFVNANWKIANGLEDNYRVIFNELRKYGLLLSDNFDDVLPILKKYI